MDSSGYDVKKQPKKTWREYIRPNRKLIPLKIFMLFFYGGFVALYPYLTIHMKEIGISVTQTGILYSVYPICVCIGGPLAGVLGDKTGHYRMTLIVFLVISCGIHSLLYYAVPVYSVRNLQHNVTLDNMAVHLKCGNSGDQKGSVATMTSNIISPNLDNNVTFALCHPKNISLPVDAAMLTVFNCKIACGRRKPLICTRDNGIENCASIEQSIQHVVRAPNFKNSTGINDIREAKWQITDGISCYDPEPVPWLGDCMVDCMAKGQVVVPCFEEKITGNQYMTFGIYLLVRLLCGLCVNLTFTLVDASLLQMVEDFKGDVGINRAFGSIGFCAVPPLSGLLVDYVSKKKGSVDYGPAFYMYFAGLTIAIIILIFTDIRVRPQSKNILKNATQLLRYPRVVAFILAFFMVGIAWGFLESFLFWFLDEDLAAPKWLLGFTNTVAGIAGIPFAVFATWIVQKTGYTKIFICGIFVFGLRFLGYSYVYNPYWILPLEALEALTSTLPLVTASIYAASFSAELLATLQGVLSGVHFGLGRGMGSFIGGFMIKDMGTRLSFQVFSGICFGVALMYTVIHYAYLRKIPKHTKKAVAEDSLEKTPALFHEAKKDHVSGENVKIAVPDETDVDLEENPLASRRPSILPVFDLGSTELASWGSKANVASDDVPNPVYRRSHNPPRTP